MIHPAFTDLPTQVPRSGRTQIMNDTKTPAAPEQPRQRAVVVVALAIVATVVVLRGLGRRWWCACGEPFLGTWDAYSSHTSQHVLDPYAVTHVLHGFVFWWLLGTVAKWIAHGWRVVIAVVIEALWEILENTPIVIDRYRQATAALGYAGDSIINSLGDILCCWLGVLLARRLGGWRSLGVFLLAETILLFWIRDNLTLNVIMLAWQSETLKHWQMGHGP